MYRQIIRSEFSIEDWITDAKVPYCCYIDTENKCIVIEERDNPIPAEYIAIPNIEELYPYNNAIGEFLEDYEVPHKMSASKYLRVCGLTQAFQVFRLENAVEKLLEWLDINGYGYIYVPDITLSDFFYDVQSTTYTFYNYVVGDYNWDASWTARKLAEGEEVSSLIMSGPFGNGKRHLVEATLNRIRELNPEHQIVHITGEELLELIVKYKSNPERSLSLKNLICGLEGCTVLSIIRAHVIWEFTDKAVVEIIDRILYHRTQFSRINLLTFDKEKVGVLTLLPCCLEAAFISLEVKKPDFGDCLMIMDEYIDAADAEEMFSQEDLEQIVVSSENVREMIGKVNKVVAHFRMEAADQSFRELYQMMSNRESRC